MVYRPQFFLPFVVQLQKPFCPLQICRNVFPDVIYKRNRTFRSFIRGIGNAKRFEQAVGRRPIQNIQFGGSNFAQRAHDIGRKAIMAVGIFICLLAKVFRRFINGIFFRICVVITPIESIAVEQLPGKIGHNGRTIQTNSAISRNQPSILRLSLNVLDRYFITSLRRPSSTICTFR